MQPARAQRGLDLGRDLPRAVRIDGAHLDALRDVAELHELLGALQVRVPDRRTGRSRSGRCRHAEALEPRRRAERRGLAAHRRDQHERVADSQQEPVRELRADDQAGQLPQLVARGVGLEVGERADLDGRQQLRRFADGARVDPLQHDRLQAPVVAAQDRVGGEERGRANNPRHAAPEQRRPGSSRYRPRASARRCPGTITFSSHIEEKPFMTESTTVITATPSATPTTQMTEMIEMKVWRPARDQVAQPDEPLDRLLDAVLHEPAQHERPEPDRAEHHDERREQDGCVTRLGERRRPERGEQAAGTRSAPKPQRSTRRRRGAQSTRTTPAHATNAQAVWPAAGHHQIGAPSSQASAATKAAASAIAGSATSARSVEASLNVLRTDAPCIGRDVACPARTSVRPQALEKWPCQIKTRARTNGAELPRWVRKEPGRGFVIIGC